VIVVDECKAATYRQETKHGFLKSMGLFRLAYVLCREEVVILLEDGSHSQQTSIGKSELFKSMAAVQICPNPMNSLLNLQYNLSNSIVNLLLLLLFFFALLIYKT